MTPPPTTTTRARSGMAVVPGMVMRVTFRSVGRYLLRPPPPPGAAPLPEHKPRSRWPEAGAGPQTTCARTGDRREWAAWPVTLPGRGRDGTAADAGITRTFGWQDMFVRPEEDPRSDDGLGDERATL